jgi:TP901 family phage tail tape measure protein
MAINPVRVVITAVDQFSRQLTTMSKGLDRFGDKATKAGKTISLAFAAPVVLLGKKAIDTAVQYEASMTRVQSFTGATADEMTKLSEATMKMAGGPTKVSEGMKLMAEQGFTASQILSGMPAVLQLAKIAQLDLGTATETVDNILEGYGKRVEDLSDINDKFAVTAKKGGIGLSVISNSMTALAPVAQTMGLGMEDLLTVVGAMGKKGVNMTRAVFAMRTGLTSLTDPAKSAIQTFNKLGIHKADVFDQATGKMKPLVGMLEMFRAKGATATDMANIFGKQAGTVLNTLVTDTTGSLEEMGAAMSNTTGEAQKMSDAISGTAAGKMAKQRAEMDRLSVTIGNNLLPLQIKLYEIGIKILSWFNNLSPSVKGVIVAVVGFAAALGPILIMAGTLVTSLSALGITMAGIGTVFTAVAGFIAGITLPIWLVIAAFAAWGVAIFQLVKNFDAIWETITNLKLLVKTVQIMFTDLFTDIAKFVLPKWAERLFGLTPSATPLPPGPAPAAAITPGEAARTTTETKTTQSNVAVSFENAPKGMRVERKNGDVDIDYSTGAMFAGATP